MERFYKLRADGFDKLTRTNLKLRAIIQKVFVFVFVFVGLLSCDNSDPIGDWLGQWKLEQMTYNGVTTTPTEQVFLRFQSQYVEAYVENCSQVTGHYVNTGDSIHMKFYYSQGSLNDLNTYYNFYNDPAISRTQEEIDKDVYPLNEKFRVEVINSDLLILSNADGRWIFKPW